MKKSKAKTKITIQVGDSMLVTGYAHYEKCTVKSIDNKVAILNNGIKFNIKTLQPTNSSYQVEVFDSHKYESLVSKSEIPKKLRKLANIKLDTLSDDVCLIIDKKLTKLIQIVEKSNE